MILEIEKQTSQGRSGIHVGNRLICNVLKEVWQSMQYLPELYGVWRSHVLTIHVRIIPYVRYSLVRSPRYGVQYGVQVIRQYLCLISARDRQSPSPSDVLLSPISLQFSGADQCDGFSTTRARHTIIARYKRFDEVQARSCIRTP
jgi:hypothetical protein